MSKAKQIKAINLATGETLLFSPHYRFSKDPKHIFAEPYFTDATAFVDSDIRYLYEAEPGDEIFIEWICDRFYAYDEEMDQHIPGPTVWRKSKVIGPVLPKTRGKDDIQ